MSQPERAPADSRPTPTIEDYLVVIYVMQRDGEEIIAARLAESWDVTPPTVTVTLRRMEKDGWITTHPAVCLTDAGREAACSVIRRHMLTEWMLARMLKVPWSRIHVEADQMEHTISDETEANMRLSLDDPQTCPHGNPLPGYEHIAAGWLPLTRVQPGDCVIIRRIHETAEDSPDLLQFLEAHGILPGVQASVTEVLPFNQTITLKMGKQTVALGFQAARYVFVEQLP
jgi:DtxR family transcriptional regulator, Mn-dependent transcriptional regulator